MPRGAEDRAPAPEAEPPAPGREGKAGEDRAGAEPSRGIADADDMAQVRLEVLADGATVPGSQSTDDEDGDGDEPGPASRGGARADETAPVFSAGFTGKTMRSLGAKVPKEEPPKRSCAHNLALLATVVVLLLLLASVVMSVMWGLDSGFAADCAGRACEACGVEDGCNWCAGPEPGMPGYCESAEHAIGSTCNTTTNPSAAACAASEALEGDWVDCRVASSNATLGESLCAAKNSSAARDKGCEWCAGQAACVPRADNTSAAVASFCDVAGLYGTGSADALSPLHEACSSTSVSQGLARTLWTDRSNDADRSTPEPVVGNETYTTNLKCVWVFECNFNETVAVQFQTVHINSPDELRIYDAWQADQTLQLGYFLDFDGDRSLPVTNETDLTTSVSGGPSARHLQSTGPVLTVQFESGSSEARAAYTLSHGRIAFPADPEHKGFHLTHSCQPPLSYYSRSGFYLLGLYAVLVMYCLRRAYKRIFYSAKTGGLWKMSVPELQTLARAMDVELDNETARTDGTATKSEMIARITQSERWPEGKTVVAGLALSTFGELPTDDDPESWGDISWYSPFFFIDVMSCVMCVFEGFTDLLFIVMQYYRPNGGGMSTMWAALSITIWSTCVFLSPPGAGPISSTVLKEQFTYKAAKEWVYKNARRPDGEHLETEDDWSAWLQTCAGRHRPQGLAADPDMKYRRMKLVPTVDVSCMKNGCAGRRMHNLRHGKGAKSESTLARQGHHASRPHEAAEDGEWVSWRQFLAAPGTILGPNMVDEDPAEGGTSRIHQGRYERAQVLGQAVDKATTALTDGLQALESSAVGQAATTVAHPLVDSKLGKAVSKAGGVAVGGGAKVVKGAKEGLKDIQERVDHKLGLDEQEGWEPGWLCGEPPANKWDSDNYQVVYGRTSTFMMYILTLLQVRVPVEGMIAWRNVRTLKTKRERIDTCFGHFWKLQVRERDFERARLYLDMALLREGIFEALPQAVLEFQNLWADEYAVLDLMSVPGGLEIVIGSLTVISEYQLTFLIMMVTLITATVDITTPYRTNSLMIGLSLYASQLLQLTARLLVFGSVLSMERENQRTNKGIFVLVCFFILSFLLTAAWFWFSEKWQWFHKGDQRFRNRANLDEWELEVKTGATSRSRTDHQVYVILEGKPGVLSEKIFLTRLCSDGEFTSKGMFTPDSSVRVTIETQMIGKLSALTIGLGDEDGDDEWVCDEVKVKNTGDGELFTFKHEEPISTARGGQRILPQRSTDRLQSMGMQMLSMQYASWWEKAFIFSAINMFTCTDKNLQTPPTSKATFVLSFWRVIEATLVCIIFMPLFGPGVDDDGDGQVDRVSAFQLKSFIAVYLSICSFACLLAAAAAEKAYEVMVRKEVIEKRDKNWKDVTQKTWATVKLGVRLALFSSFCTVNPFSVAAVAGRFLSCCCAGAGAVLPATLLLPVRGYALQSHAPSLGISGVCRV